MFRMPSRFRAALFDFDGTLADTLWICIGAFQDAVEPYWGRRPEAEEISGTFGPSEEGSALALAPQDPEGCLAAYLTHYERMHARCTKPFPGVREMLSDLRAGGCRLGMVSGKGAKTAEISMRLLGLETEFERVETGSAHGSRKAEAIASVLAEWGIIPRDAAYVGDAPSDVRIAKQTGVCAVAAAWAASADLEALRDQQPDALFESIEDCTRWLCAPAG